MLIGLALAVVGVVALVRGGDSLAADRRAPEQILDERLARGEIDIEEYIRCRDLLRSAH